MSKLIKSSISQLKLISGKVLRSNKRTYPKYLKSVQSSEKVLNGMVAYNKYGGYFTPVSSKQRPAVQQIFKGGVFEPDTIKFIRENCGEGDVVHAGTFFGDFLPGISSAIHKDSKIWAFEPNKENFRCAQITVLINNLINVTLTNAGLGNEKMTTKMLVETESGISLGGSSRVLKKEEKGKTIDVSIVRIDDIVPVERNISIIQLDVEGFEKEALQGAAETIKRCKPILILEDNNKVIGTNWFSENILALGYEIKAQIHSNTLLQVP